MQYCLEEFSQKLQVNFHINYGSFIQLQLTLKVIDMLLQILFPNSSFSYCFL